ncbi:cell division protein FtsW [Corynebacterium striatum]
MLVIATSYVSQGIGWGGVASSDEEGVPWSEVTSDGVILNVVGFMAFSFVLVLPIYLVRRHVWDKKQQDASGGF